MFLNSFTFYSPTKVIFGKDAELNAAKEIKEFGGTKVIIVYGGGSVVRSASRKDNQTAGDEVSYIRWEVSTQPEHVIAEGRVKQL